MPQRNAPLTGTRRLRLARCVVEDGWPLRRAAERFQVSAGTAARWVSRYRLLGEAGSDKTKILSTTIYLADVGTFAEMNAVWDAWVPAGHAPARATVEAKLAAPAYTVEIACIAAKS